MGVSGYMDVFHYVSLKWCQHQEGACEYKLKNFKYSCIEWFFCHFSQAYITQRGKQFNISPFYCFISNISKYFSDIIQNIQHEDRNCNFLQEYTEVSLHPGKLHTVAESSWQSCDWNCQTAYCLQGDCSCSYFWIAL